MFEKAKCVFYINYCQYLTDGLAACVLRPMRAKVAEYVSRCHCFRDPITGRAHPRLQTILKMSHLTAERRVRSIFYWAHVLGTTAEVLVAPARMHALVAVSTLQLMLIATRGHRPYTRTELEEIFHNVGRQFFRAMESLSSIADDMRMEKGHEAHRRRPNDTHPPVPFKRMRRYCTYIFHFTIKIQICFLRTKRGFQKTNLDFKIQMHSITKYTFAF